MCHKGFRPMADCQWLIAEHRLEAIDPYSVFREAARVFARYAGSVEFVRD
jgi:hypothetical protein